MAQDAVSTKMAAATARRRRVKQARAVVPLVLAGTLGTATLTTGLALAVAQARPDLDLGPASDLLAVHEARAEAAFAAGRLDAAAASTDAALAEAPMTSQAWARRAAIALRREGRLGPETVAALERSYAVAPYGPEITAWRLGVLLEHWGELPPGLRASALDEMKVYAAARPGRARALGQQVSNPSGRLAMAAAVRLARLEARRAAQS
jgi:hypothetical protein